MLRTLKKCLVRPGLQGGSKRNFSTVKAKCVNEIPGPLRIPIWGNLYLYKSGYFPINQYHKILLHLHKKYGPIAREYLGSELLVHVFDPVDVRTVYQAEGRMPQVSPLQGTVQLYRSKKGLSLGLGNLNGEEWYRLRSAAQQFMLRPSEVAHFLPLVDEAALQLVERITTIVGSEGSPVDNLRDEIAKWSLESAGAVCFERSLGCFQGGETELQAQRMIDANKSIFQISGYLKFSLPIYRYIPTPKWKKLVAAEDMFYGEAFKYVNNAIDELNRLQNGNDTGGKLVFLSNLLSKKELTRADVDIITLSLFGDGLSTTTPFLMFCLRCLADNCDVQEQLRTELLKAIEPDGSVSADALAHMPFLRAFIKETFRMYPNGTEVSRIIQKDLVLAGYEVPSGTHVNLNPTVNFRSEKYFSLADQFIPNRWLRSKTASNIDPYLLTPFGHGTRTCAGRRFAEQDLHIVLTRLLQRFRLLSVADEPLQQIYETLLFPKEPLGVKFIPLPKVSG